MIKKISVALAVLIGVGVIWRLLWSEAAFLPGWVTWENGNLYGQSGTYQICLSRRAVKVLGEGGVIWTSPEGVKVQKVLSCDVDNDREEELVLLCWKRGRYGRLRPFWVEEDEKAWSQHLFVYEYGGGEIHPKWMSSYIGLDVADVAADDREAPFCRLLLTDPEGNLSCWRWDTWGFTREETDVSFVVFGDNLLHEPIYQYALRQDAEFGFLFENFREAIFDSDVAVINQETPLTDDPALYGGYPRFGTPAQAGQAVADAGFDVVTCATNHMLDRGADGADFTKEFFRARNVVCVGIQSKEETEYRPYELIVKKGIRFALLNYTYGTNGIRIPKEYPYMVHLLADGERVRGDIAEAKKAADFVMVFAHWGTEDSPQTDEFQREWTEVFLESGVDVVVGTHPHVLQPYEVLRDENGHEMLVYYSIGNYISAQAEKACVRGGMAEFTVSRTADGFRVTEYGLEPLVIEYGDGRYTVRPR